MDAAFLEDAIHCNEKPGHAMQSKPMQYKPSAASTTDADVEFVTLVMSMPVLVMMASDVVMICTQRVAMLIPAMQCIARQCRSNEA